STLNEWKNGKSSLKQQQFLQLLRDVLSYSREDKLALQVFPYQEGKRLEVTLRDRLVALIQIAGPKTLYFREFRESAPNLTPGKYDHPSYSVLTRTTKPLEENLALWAETFEPQLVFFATTRLDEELDEYTRETLLQELLSALHCSEDSSVVVEGVLPTLSLEVKEGLRLLSRADIHIVEQRAVVSYHSNIQKYPLPCSDRKKDSLRKEIAFPEASIPKRSTLLFEKLAPIFKQEAETLMLWAVPDEGARPSDEKRAAVKRCLQEALGLPEDRFVELVVQNGEPFVLALWASGKPLLEIVMDFEGSGWKLLWLNDYRESDLTIDPKKVSAIPFREAGKLEKVMTNAAEFINEQALFFHAACQSIHTAKLPEESRTLLERALMSCLGVSKDGHMYISKVGRSFHIIATQGLELVAELKYAPGADTIEWCYHRAFIREKRPAPEEYLIPVRRPIRPKTLVQVIEDPEGTEEPESPSKWQLTFSDSKLDSFSMMNPAPHLGGAVIEVQIDEPTRINHERSAVCLRTILSNGAVNDCARVEIAEDGKLLGIFFEMLDQDPTQSYRFDFE
ncbi:MAG: hypothetical protein KDD64_17080, partial [Bdellovibrionales bacterium]|nr:hypothetical protein [Bdellovibrionales bacterium]